MHFTVLYLMKGETLDRVTPAEIEQDFCDRFCYCCGETTAKYLDYCDWFQIGGRWNDLLFATTGYKGDRSWGNCEESLNHQFSIVEIKDLICQVDPNSIHAIATKTKIFEERRQVEYYCQLINSKKIKGVIALMDCHN